MTACHALSWPFMGDLSEKMEEVDLRLAVWT
jgi:hypothetical protein